jgi:hypothetical protein
MAGQNGARCTLPRMRERRPRTVCRARAVHIRQTDHASATPRSVRTNNNSEAAVDIHHCARDACARDAYARDARAKIARDD